MSNQITAEESYALPLIDDHLDRLYSKKYFTSVDLALAYYQAPLMEDGQSKTAFSTPHEHY